MELAGLSVATSIVELESLAVPFLTVEDLPSDLSKDFDIIVDAMFGFSFHGTPRPPFDDLIQKLVYLHKCNQTRQKSSLIVSIDIPSGWHVEGGDVNGEGIKPDMLVSLTAPKLCAKKFSGPHHFLGELLHLLSFSSSNGFDDAVVAGLKEPNAMCLSTVGKDGKPSSRMVLLKGVDKDGFVWYTNYESRKANQLSEILKHHSFSTGMVLIGRNEDFRSSMNLVSGNIYCMKSLTGISNLGKGEGFVQKVSDEESEQYFHSRPRGSQIGAIVSKQSTIVPGRHVLYQQFKELEEKFSDM
ncbi:hypothetical protein GH714_003021 [Hevea brasiliensis]|uniref:pyridoxal 5'-phosphate synthase n=1 Tax=Hevea brasiliensis TaxID=3981 RepID=A0A6A6LGU3_HEVBR|nr:hypothetical protein GH714_003021 [Hevea brasiliensis]